MSTRMFLCEFLIDMIGIGWLVDLVRLKERNDFKNNSCLSKETIKINKVVHIGIHFLHFKLILGIKELYATYNYAYIILSTYKTLTMHVEII